jgi:hypothetical protein
VGRMWCISNQVRGVVKLKGTCSSGSRDHQLQSIYLMPLSTLRLYLPITLPSRTPWPLLQTSPSVPPSRSWAALLHASLATVHLHASHLHRYRRADLAPRDHVYGCKEETAPVVFVQTPAFDYGLLLLALVVVLQFWALANCNSPGFASVSGG